jgi:cell division protein FtsL
MYRDDNGRLVTKLTAGEKALYCAWATFAVLLALYWIAALIFG